MQVNDAKYLDDLFLEFPYFSAEEKNLIRNNVYFCQYKKGARVFTPGSKADELTYLVSGKAKVYKSGLLGRTQILRLVRPGSLFGFTSVIIDEAEHSSTGQTLETSVVAHMPQRCIDQLLSSNIKLTNSFLRGVTRSLGRSNQRLIDLTQKHVRARMADTLLLVINTFGLNDDGITLDAYLPRHDLACLANMTSANAIRTLSTFHSEGIINIKGKKIEIIKLDDLRQISLLG